MNNNNQEEALIKSINERNQNLFKGNSQKSYEEFKSHQERSVIYNKNRISDVDSVENERSENISLKLWRILKGKKLKNFFSSFFMLKYFYEKRIRIIERI